MTDMEAKRREKEVHDLENMQKNTIERGKRKHAMGRGRGEGDRGSQKQDIL